MLHCIRIADDRVLYSSNYVETARFIKERAANEGYMIKVPNVLPVAS